MTHVTTSETKLSDHSLGEIFLSFNPCQPYHSSPPEFNSPTFRSLDFNKANFEDINNILSSVEWDVLYDECDEEECPELFTLILFQACMLGCPTKTPLSKKGNKALRIFPGKSAIFKKLWTQLQSLRKNVALIHYSIRYAIVDEHFFRRSRQLVK